MSFFSFWKRRRLMKAAMPAHWQRILQENVGLYGRLRPAHRGRLEAFVRVFLDEKLFEGCGGLKVTDAVRVTIAGQACLLFLERDMDFLPGLNTILVYPAGYRARHVEHPIEGVVSESETEQAGQSRPGAIILSWDDTRAGGRGDDDGSNVVLHEFAHQADLHYRLTESLLERSFSDLSPWQRDLRREYQHFLETHERGGKLLLDPYAATDPAEFFAVATESFFERPSTIQDARPRLYRALKTLYRLDPSHVFLD